jgi:hypothetical protein
MEADPDERQHGGDASFEAPERHAAGNINTCCVRLWMMGAAALRA